jgi:hypothetical protein
MQKKYQYYGFGLKILSEVKFPEFYPIKFSDHDIIIEFGSIPSDISGILDESKYISMVTPQGYFLNIPDVAKYFTSKGKKVIIDPYRGYDLNSIRLFLLSNAMAAILVQRNKILLHASSILHKEQLILFLGTSGSGKSTTVAELSKRGYKIFSDDICVLSESESDNFRIIAYSAYPMMKLWDDTIHSLNDIKFETSYKLRPELNKFGYFFHDDFDTGAYPIKEILILDADNSENSISSKDLNGYEAFEMLGKNTYRSQFILDNSIQKLHFDTISKLIQTSKIKLINRPKKGFTVEAFIDFIEKSIQ